MSSALELIVRPFQTKDLTPRPGSIGGQELPPVVEEVVIHIGKPGGKSFTYIYEFTSSVPGGNKYKEYKRETERKTVFNPDDSTQFVEFDRIKKLSLAREDDPKVKQHFTMNWAKDD